MGAGESDECKAQQEKHVPTVVYADGKAKVTLKHARGEDEHKIEKMSIFKGATDLVKTWETDALNTDSACKNVEDEDLSQGFFCEVEVDCKAEGCEFEAYEICSKHGVWKGEKVSVAAAPKCDILPEPFKAKCIDQNKLTSKVDCKKTDNSADQLGLDIVFTKGNQAGFSEDCKGKVEKHEPTIEYKDGKVKVTLKHPLPTADTDTHFIEEMGLWNKTGEVKTWKKEDFEKCTPVKAGEPADFSEGFTCEIDYDCSCSVGCEFIAYEACSEHGVWMSEWVKVDPPAPTPPSTSSVADLAPLVTLATLIFLFAL